MGIAAHDLRAPLSAIVASAELLEMEPDPDKARQTARFIQNEGMDMSLLIGRFLDSEAMESGTVLPIFESFPLRFLAQEVLGRHSRRAAEKAIALELAGPEGLFLTQADLKFTKEILDNLVSNALKFSNPGKRVTVRLEEKEGRVLISVEDQGPGLSEEDLKRLFGRFVKLSSRPTGGEKSTGLGLFIVKHLVDAMGGRIWVESEPGRGANFRVELPAAT
jgi:two-component system, sensor histidine kinase and response regulator